MINPSVKALNLPSPSMSRFQWSPSFLMPPVAVPLVELTTAPLVGLLRLTVKVSFPSYSLSCVVVTVKVLVESPWAKDRVDVLAMKSLTLAVSELPIEVANVTSSVAWASPLRVTVKTMSPPSKAGAAAMLNTGEVSSLLMVPVAMLLVELIVAPLVGLLRLTVKVSFSSYKLSCVVATMKVLVVWPWAKDNIWAVGCNWLKSLSLAEPLIEVATVTCSVAWASPVRVTVKTILSPSVAAAAAMLNMGSASSLLMVPVAVPLLLPVRSFFLEFEKLPKKSKIQVS